MKRISVNLLSLKQKHGIVEHTQKVIENNFSTPIQNLEHVLQNNVDFFTAKFSGETILKQSLVKGLFPRISYQRQIIMETLKTHINDKILLANPKDKADFRLIGEILTANRFANSTDVIKEITMNYENPTKVKTFPISRNTNNDITIHYQIGGKSCILEADIKAGNNADKPFSGIVASVPYTEKMENYYILNNKIIELHDIQKIRMDQVKIMQNSNNTNSLLRELRIQLEYIDQLPLDIIKKNILIQEQIFIVLSAGTNFKNPSFYVGYIVPNMHILHQKFFEKLQPYITPHIFDNKTLFNTFMKQALLAYNENIAEIAKNTKINRKLLQDSGLAEIVDDIFI